MDSQKTVDCRIIKQFAVLEFCLPSLRNPKSEFDSRRAHQPLLILSISICMSPLAVSGKARIDSLRPGWAGPVTTPEGHPAGPAGREPGAYVHAAKVTTRE